MSVDTPAAAGMPPRRFHQAAISRAGWNITDQALSSLTNAALSIFVARSVDAHSFGAFAICFSIYSLVIGGTRTLVSDPLTIRFGAAGPESFAAARRPAIAGAACLGAVAGALLVVAAFTQTGDLRNSLLALGLTMPGLALQDALRLSFISERRPRAAAANDFLWAALQGAGVALLLFTDVSSAALFVAVWGAGAAVAAFYGIVSAQAYPVPRRAFRWLRDQLHMSGFFISEYVAVAGAIQLAMLFVAIIGEVSDVGAIRGGFVLLGPLSVIFFGSTFFAVPELVRRRMLPPRHHLKAAAALSGSLLLATLLWGGLLLQIPDELGRELLGEAWVGGRAVVPALIALQAGVALAIGPVCVMRAFGAARQTMEMGLLLAPLLLLFAIVGVRLDGAEGAALGLAIAQWIPVAVWWARMRKVLSAGPPPSLVSEAQQT
jgi:hypothetical protein